MLSSVTAKARLQMRPLDQFELKHNMVNMFYKLSFLFDEIRKNTELWLTLVLFCVRLS